MASIPNIGRGSSRCIHSSCLGKMHGASSRDSSITLVVSRQMLGIRSIISLGGARFDGAGAWTMSVEVEEMSCVLVAISRCCCKVKIDFCGQVSVRSHGESRVASKSGSEPHLSLSLAYSFWWSVIQLPPLEEALSAKDVSKHVSK